jgi:hypothetical protein
MRSRVLRGSIRVAQVSASQARSVASRALACGLVVAWLPLESGAFVPAGAEFQVNTYTTAGQYNPSAAATPDGDFVVVWTSLGSPGTDTSSYSVQGRRHSSGGAAQGAQFQVNSYTSSEQWFPSVGAASDGSFVVVWFGAGSSGSDTSSYSVHGQRYASNGSAQGAEFQVNSYTTGPEQRPSVAVAPTGDFVVVWESAGSSGTDASGASIQGQRYASNGSAQGAEFQVNSYTSNNQARPSVSAAPNGDFVVVWQSYGSVGTDSSNRSIQGQRYASNGSSQGAQFQVNTYTTSSQILPSVSAAGTGFVVVWRSYGSSGTDSDFYSIQGQRYASNGSSLGSQFQVNTYTTSGQNSPSVSAASNGDFMVAWQSYGSSGADGSAYSVEGQRYTSDGSPQGAQFLVNTYTTSGQGTPSAATAANGNFVVVWGSAGSNGTDSFYDSIQGQRYRVAPAPVPALSPSMLLALGAMLMLLASYVLSRRG